MGCIACKLPSLVQVLGFDQKYHSKQQSPLCLEPWKHCSCCVLPAEGAEVHAVQAASC